MPIEQSQITNLVETNAVVQPEQERKSGRGRGFASMSPELQRQIASKGGKARTKKELLTNLLLKKPE